MQTLSLQSPSRPPPRTRPAGWHFFPLLTCLDVSIRHRQTGAGGANRPLSHRALNKEPRPRRRRLGVWDTGRPFFFLCSFFFFSPSWHRNGLVGRKRESGGKTNDEKVYSIPVPSLNTWKERERHIWIQSASLWWHQVFFSQIRGLEATGCLWQLGARSRLLPSEHMTPSSSSSSSTSPPPSSSPPSIPSLLHPHRSCNPTNLQFSGGK